MFAAHIHPNLFSPDLAGNRRRVPDTRGTSHDHASLQDHRDTPNGAQKTRRLGSTDLLELGPVLPINSEI